MLEKLKKMIGLSSALSEEQKTQYLSVLQFLPVEDLLVLLSVLEKEQEGVDKILELEKASEKNFYQDLTVEMKQFYDSQYKNVQKLEEESEESAAENVLNEIED